jgi:hypothetical protein
MENGINYSPSYREILSEVGSQIKYRKDILRERVFLIIWPLLLLVILALAIASSIQNKSDFPILGSVNSAIVLMYIWGIIAVILIVRAEMIFFLEKLIWADSYFDQKKLDSKSSWRIAKKIFIPAVKTYLLLFCRFYLLPLLAFLGITIFYVFFVVEYDKNLSWYFYAIAVGIAIPFLVYAYYLRVKFRYFWFVFLDMYGSKDFGFNALYKEMTRLNEVGKSEEFKKALFIDFGTDSTKTATDILTNTFINGLDRSGTTGRAIGGLMGMFIKELTGQTISFGNNIAIYILYRFARFQLYHRPQEVNNFIYQL